MNIKPVMYSEKGFINSISPPKQQILPPLQHQQSTPVLAAEYKRRRAQYRAVRSPRGGQVKPDSGEDDSSSGSFELVGSGTGEQSPSTLVTVFINASHNLMRQNVILAQVQRQISGAIAVAELADDKVHGALPSILMVWSMFATAVLRCLYSLHRLGARG